MTEQSLSPVFHKIIPNKIVTMDFFSALKEVTAGKKIHKLEWEDKEYYGLLDEARLRLHKPDGKMYDWVISEGDLIGRDWIVI